MANFVIIVDPDAEARSRYIEKIKPLLPPVEGLIINSCEVGDFSAIWAANPQAPISYKKDEEGVGIIWGDALFQRESKRVDPGTLRKLWKNPNSESPIFDGFYAAAVYHPEEGLAMGADIIGLFPVYYYQRKDVILVGSSPELFRYHPLFQAEFNPAGLVGILLTNGLLEGETLWKNVRRLEPGNLLISKTQENFTTEVKQYQIASLKLAENQDFASLSFPKQTEILGQVLEDAIAKQTSPSMKHALLLSGGLDSRTLAGFLHRRNIPTVALTLGRTSDFEIKTATEVVRLLGLEHHLLNLPFEEYPSYIEYLTKWEHLANGCHRFMFWGLTPQLKQFAPRFLAGFLMDSLLGGQLGYQITPDNISYEKFFQRRINCWGFPPSVLEKLLNKEVFGDIVKEKNQRIQEIYQSYSDVEFKRGLYFDLYHRQRYHVGSVTWSLCFGSWPVIPCLDMQLLATIEAMSVEIIGNRNAQKDILCHLFPELAKIPLINNSAFTSIPIIPKTSNFPYNSAKWLVTQWRKVENKLGYERRYFCRIYDINRPGWHAIREQVEPYRDRVNDLFNMAEFNRLILPPHRRMPCGWNPTESSGFKALLGFVLWSKNNL